MHINACDQAHSAHANFGETGSIFNQTGNHLSLHSIKNHKYHIYANDTNIYAIIVATRADFRAILGIQNVFPHICIDLLNVNSQFFSCLKWCFCLKRMAFINC